MDSMLDFIDEINEKIERMIKDNFTQTNAAACGLDVRGGYRLYVNEEGIIVKKTDDRALQYYAAFEYCEDEYRSEIGDYVFYSADDDYVRPAVEAFLGVSLDEEDEYVEKIDR